MEITDTTTAPASDEAAFRDFCQAHQLAPTPEAWDRFAAAHDPAPERPSTREWLAANNYGAPVTEGWD